MLNMTNDFTTITIDNIDISRYSEYYVINHIVKQSEPKRSSNFAMANINDIAQIEIPEIYITFKYLPIAIYRELFKATRKAEFKVVYYDQDYNIMRTNMFYLKDQSTFSPHSWGASRFRNKNDAFLGFKDFKLNLVCTMNPISDVDIQISYSGSTLNKPYYISHNITSGGANIPLNIKITDMSGNNLAGDVIASFSIDDLSFSNVAQSGAGKYTLNCAVGGSTFIVDTSSVKHEGEYTLFFTINNLTYNNNSYGSITVSLVLSLTR